MRRATTPTHEFTLPFDAAMVSRFLLTYKQGDKIILEKREADMSVEGNTWSYTLTQEETNLFATTDAAQAQIRVLTPSGNALASEVMAVVVDPVLNDEVLE